MKFHDTGIENTVLPFPALEHIMEQANITRGGQWDWERATYDFKFENHHDGSIYYLRIPALAVEGEFEKPSAVAKLGIPYVGHHYYPHGVEYDEDFPEHVVTTCQERLAHVKALIDDYQTHAEE
ncbi:YugN family protein [Tuberibacillus sp. Marseille-P3662]|uniref:YugN family protein n=1 Tax=Tuberibacillus sp. Marseille-P3662 TaxID=1965358 RepID=UPI000A1CB61E|nr:YugN family protein [Tuberibacillus sp. Marseille-P3662]